MLTQNSIGEFFFDKAKREYICMQYVTGCCHTPYFLMKEFDSINNYPYNAKGERLDYKLKPVLDSSFNLKFEG